MTDDLTPPVIPAGWVPFELDGVRMIYTVQKSLRATFSRETYTGEDHDTPLGPGVYRRIVLSRRNCYPGWDEMRNFIQACPLFDHDRDIFMLLPPAPKYVNVHPYCFHWWQKEA